MLADGWTWDRSKRLFLSVIFTVLSFRKLLLIRVIRVLFYGPVFTTKKIEFAFKKKYGFYNFVPALFDSDSHLRHVQFFCVIRTSIKGTLIGHVSEKRWPGEGSS